MNRGAKILAGFGKLAGIVGLISLGVTLAVLVGSLYVLGIHPSNLPILGSMLFYAPPAIAIGGITIWLFSKLFVRYLQEGAPAEAPSSELSSDTEPETSSEDTKDYLNEFNKANLYVSLFFSVLFVVAVGSTSIMNAVSGSPLAIVAGFLTFATQVLGGAPVHFINMAWFGTAWFGIRRYNASEAWMAGLIGWALITVSGVIMLSMSLGAIGIVIAGVKILHSGYRSRGETELQFLDEYIADTSLEKFID